MMQNKKKSVNFKLWYISRYSLFFQTKRAYPSNKLLSDAGKSKSKLQYFSFLLPISQFSLFPFCLSARSQRRRLPGKFVKFRNFSRIAVFLFCINLNFRRKVCLNSLNWLKKLGYEILLGDSYEIVYVAGEFKQCSVDVEEFSSFCGISKPQL